MFIFLITPQANLWLKQSQIEMFWKLAVNSSSATRSVNRVFVWHSRLTDIFTHMIDGLAIPDRRQRISFFTFISKPVLRQYLPYRVSKVQLYTHGYCSQLLTFITGAIISPNNYSN